MRWVRHDDFLRLKKLVSHTDGRMGEHDKIGLLMFERTAPQQCDNEASSAPRMDCRKEVLFVSGRREAVETTLLRDRGLANLTKSNQSEGRPSSRARQKSCRPKFRCIIVAIPSSFPLGFLSGVDTPTHPDAPFER